jgi:hypothetical protein
MMSKRTFIPAAAAFVLVCCLIATATASCDACSLEPEGGWGPPDYSDNPYWDNPYGWDSDYNVDTGFSWDDSSGDTPDTGTGDTSSSDSPGTSVDSGSGNSASDSDSSSYAGGGSPENGLIWRMMGDALFEQRLYNDSVEAYGKALEYDPYALKSWTGMGRVLLELGRPAKAAEAFKNSIRLDPGDADLYALLGDAWAANGSYDDAIVNYQRALAINPRITGVSEKILFSEEAQAGLQSTSDTVPDTLPVAEPTGSTVLQNDTPSVVRTEAEQAPASPQAAFPGIVTGLSALIICFVLVVKRH